MGKEEMLLEIERLEELIEIKADYFDWNKPDLSKWYSMIEAEQSRISELYRKIRILEEPRMSNLPDYGHLMTIERFIDCVKCGGFINYDGYGEYATETQTSNIIILPSDVIADEYRKDFSHVVWFNR